MEISEVYAPTETRYFTGDSKTENGLSAKWLRATQGSSGSNSGPWASYQGSHTGYIGMRVWKRSSGGIETEITAGSPVAVCSNPNNNAIVTKSATWSCPSTSLASTDSIVVRVYMKVDSGAWQQVQQFTTEQLNAQTLNAATWTVYFTFSVDTLWAMTYFYYGSGRNSRITNFVYTAAPAPASITITSSPTGSGFVKVDGSAIATPQTFTWAVGSTHTLEALSPVSGLSGTRYVWTSWSDGGAQTHTYTAPSSAQTVTANYKTQYQVTFTSSGIGSDTGTATIVTVNGVNYQQSQLPYTAWYDSGASISYSFASPITASSTKQYVWTSTSGLSQTAQSGSFTVSVAGTVTGSYKTQYRHTVTSSPATGSGFVTVDGSAQSTPYTTPWWDSGSSHTLAALSPVTGGTSKQYLWTSWSDGGAQSHTISPTSSTTFTANYKTQYQLTISISPSSSGSTNPAGSPWYDSGSPASVTATPNSGYQFDYWTLDGSNGGSSNPISVTMNGPHTLVANFKATTVTITFQVSMVSVDASGAVLTVDGTAYTYAQLPKTFTWTIGSAHSVSAANPVSAGSGKRYAFTSWTNGDGLSGASGTYTTPSSSQTVTANYKTQYYLTVNSAYDSPTPTSSWFDAGTSITASVSSPISGGSGVQYVCAGWTGTGSVPASGSATSTTFTINAASSITWNWKIQYYLTVNSAYDSPTGASWYDSGATANFAVTSPASGPEGTRYVCTGFSGDASGSETSGSITMTGPKTITFNWKTQYQLTMQVNPTGSGTVSPASGWYDANSPVSISATPASGYVFSSWSGSGSGSYSGASNPASVTMNGPITETANFQVATVSITITSSPTGSGFVKVDGSSITTPQTFSWTVGSTHTLEALSPVSGGADIQFVWTSWSDGGGRSHTYTTPSSSQTVTANYKTQYQLSINVNNPSMGSTNPPLGSYWHDSGSSVEVTAIANPGYGLSHWNLDGSEAGSSNPITVTMSGGHQLVAHFTSGFVAVTVTSSPTGSGFVKIDGQAVKTPYTTTWTHGTTHTLEALSPVGAGPDTQYVWVSWSDGGARSHQVTATGGSSTFTATFKTQYLLSFGTNPAGLSPQPSANPAGPWYDVGVSVTLTANAISGFDFKYWKLEGQGMAEGQNSITVTMNTPHTAIAEYAQSSPSPSSKSFAFPMYDPLIVYGLGIVASTLCLLAAKISKRGRLM